MRGNLSPPRAMTMMMTRTPSCGGARGHARAG